MAPPLGAGVQGPCPTSVLSAPVQLCAEGGGTGVRAQSRRGGPLARGPSLHPRAVLLGQVTIKESGLLSAQSSWAPPRRCGSVGVLPGHPGPVMLSAVVHSGWAGGRAVPSWTVLVSP